MPINILMPALSPTMEKGNLAKWLKKEGEPVKPGDVLAEIETDKATMEVEAVDEGTLGKILVAEGTQDIPVNQPIAVLLGEGEDKSALAAAPQAAPPKPAAKPAEAAPAPAAKEPAKAETPKPETPKETQVTTAAAAPSKSDSGAGRVFASPLARRLAKDGNIDLGRVSGSGPHGRIVKADIDAAASGKAPLAARQPSAPAAGPAPIQAPSDAQIMKLFEEGSYEVVPHDNVRKIIAKRLIEAKQTIPHYYLTMDTEIDALLALRKDINAAAPRDKNGDAAWKVSVNDLIIKALALALQRVPDANVTWTEGGMLKHKRSDVGVAVSIPGGLITQVVRSADTKRISAIATEMKDLIARARSRKLAPHEYQGGTTAVSNLGMYDIKDFAAVINPPHASILAVGAGMEKPVVKKGEVRIATVMSVTLSADHRAIDGALGAELLGAFKALIEKPAGMLA
jgi:pyruvate dehydrogenase E2 component (dihydrolipoamide acetyltransferase)